MSERPEVPPRILVVNPYGKFREYNGPATLLHRLFGALSSVADIHVITTAQAAPPLGHVWSSTTRSILNAPELTARAQLRWAISATIATVREEPRPDLVHIHGVYFFNLLTALAARARGVPYVLLATLEGGDLGSGKADRFPGIRSLRRSLVANADAGLALSDGISAEYEAYGLHRGRIIRISNIVSEEYLDEFDNQWRTQAHNNRTIIFSGLLCNRKQPHLLLESLAILRNQKYPTAQARFVGPFANEDYESRFWACVKRLDLVDAVEVTGFTRDVCATIIADASVFVLPSLHEGLPGSLAEAMALGLPCVVTDAGAMAEEVDRAGAGTVVASDPHAIAEAIEKRWDSAALWHEESASAHLYARMNYSPRTVAETYTGYIEKVLENRS